MKNVRIITLLATGLILSALLATTHLYDKTTEKKDNKSTISTAIVDKTSLDSVIDFGYNCMWFAVKTTDKKGLTKALKIKDISESNWKVGVDSAYKGAIFITPHIADWTLACGSGLPHADSKEGIEEINKILCALSNEFGEAQFFCTNHVVEYHCWIKATKGHITRIYSYLGETGENIIIKGEPTTFEKTMNLVNTFSKEAKSESYLERKDIVLPDEELVMKVAENWSVNPTTLSKRKDIATELGILGQR
ncbi:MAG: hypothetical protein WCG08_10770 [Paludibacter sp.]